jgi:hypothetical protein
MQQAAMDITQTNLQTIGNNSVENNNEQYPWFLIQSENERVRYRHDWITDFLGQDMKHDGLGLCFNFSKNIEPGTTLDIGIPLPEAVHKYKADVVVSSKNDEGYEIGIWLHTSSDADLELLLRSCEYAS